MKQYLDLKVDLENPDEARHTIDELVKMYEEDKLKWTAEELAEAKHLAMKIMEQLCLDGYSISWSKADNAISLWMLDEDSRNHSNTFCMTDPVYWNTWIGKCVCLCRATGSEVPAFIIKKAGECW
nr:MAG TPA: hypothetical protein [Caudoviricetes sp.]